MTRKLFTILIPLGISLCSYNVLLAQQKQEPEPINLSAFKYAVAMVETGDNQAAVGQAGERTKYQFMKSTWTGYSEFPFDQVSNDPDSVAETERVMDLHIKTLQRFCRSLNKQTTVYNMALIHNAGYGNVRRGNIQPRHKDYAQRVTNLYNDRLKKTSNSAK